MSCASTAETRNGASAAETGTINKSWMPNGKCIESAPSISTKSSPEIAPVARFARTYAAWGDCAGPLTVPLASIPGLTENSLCPRAARAAGIPFKRLLDLLVDMALERGAPEAAGSDGEPAWRRTA